MAVPKKRTSRSKKNIRKSVWKQKASEAAIKAFSLAQSILTGRSNSFSYLPDNESSKISSSNSDDKAS